MTAAISWYSSYFNSGDSFVLLWQSSELNVRFWYWDGTFKSKLAPQGSYVYWIVYTAYSTGTETQVKTGTVMLVRCPPLGLPYKGRKLCIW
jgi:hypothetical protein